MVYMNKDYAFIHLFPLLIELSSDPADSSFVLPQTEAGEHADFGFHVLHDWFPLAFDKDCVAWFVALVWKRDRSWCSGVL